MAALPTAELLDMESWSEVQVRARLEDILPSLLETLDNDSTELRMRCLRLLLITCLPHVPPASAEHMLLRKALGAAKSIFDEVLSVDDSLKADNEDLMVSLLQVAIELMNCVAAVADCVLRAQLPGAFPSAATEGLRVIQRAVTLCSRNLERGALLLRKTSATLQSLLAALGDDPVPIYDNEELIEHAQLCAQLGEQLEGLDMAAMAHAWKSFARLAQRQAPRLRGQLNVSPPITHIAYSVCTAMNSLRALRVADKKAGNAVKVAGFLLKLVIRLCEDFQGVLGDCHSSLLDLLAALATPRLAFPLEADAARHLDVGVSPLLAATLHDAQLVQLFKQRVQSLRDDPQALNGVLHLSALVCMACAQNSELRALWQDLALDTVLSLVDRAPSPTKQTYEFLVTHVGGLTTTSPPADFGRIEGTLLAVCATPRPLAAILASDVLVLAARVAQPNVAVAQVARLAEILAIMPQSHGRRCVSALVARLFRTLPDSERYRLLKRFPVAQNLGFWEAVGVSSLPKRLVPCVVETLTFLKEQSQPQQTDVARRALKTIEDSIEELSTTKFTLEERGQLTKLGRRLLNMAGSQNGQS